MATLFTAECTIPTKKRWMKMKPKERMGEERREGRKLKGKRGERRENVMEK